MRDSYSSALQNAWCDEDQEFPALVCVGVALEQPAEQRQAIERRRPVDADVSRAMKTPPMTVVVPSLTCTRVFARCVSIWTLPSDGYAGAARSRRMICMITVFAAVICGVTLSVSAASL